MLSQRDAMELFELVMGFPETKTGGLLRVVGEWGLLRQRILFVGDAEKDASAAAEVGVHFCPGLPRQIVLLRKSLMKPVT